METLAIVGVIETLLLVVGVIYAVFLWARGILPVLYRLGNGLAKRKIAIFAKGDNLSSIKSLLADSKLFRQNIIEVPSKNDLGRAEEASIYLVYWHDWSGEINDILDKKPDRCPMIVYAPYNKGKIPDDQMENLDGKRNTSVTNFRGRLLNDVVTAMITTKL
ncbi:MAG: hypothetical protein HYV13_02940 [Candidatus Doudnabacteria bacterium]|nr:hypothetical protein [Candidatus Doudnabacteria bacterium]